MASLLASSVSFSSIKVQVKLFKNHPGQLRQCSMLLARHRVSPTYCLRNLGDQFGKLNEKLQWNSFREKLSAAVPHWVKDFPWKKAENILQKRLLLVGQKVLKWSVIVFVVVSSLSDAIFSISCNRELIIPFGLLAGCLMASFFKEVSDEMVLRAEGKDFRFPLIGIGCFFVLVKVIAVYFQTNIKVFLLQLANGGLMQVLWLWKESTDHNDKDPLKCSAKMPETMTSH